MFQLTYEQQNEHRLAYERNLYAIYLWTVGTMRETAKAICALDAAGIKGQLTEPSVWRPLRKIGVTWTRGAHAQMRDDLAFHLGTEQMAIDGVRLWAESAERLVIAEGEGGLWLDGRQRGGEDVLLVGARLQTEATETVVRDASSVAVPLAAGAHAVLVDLLRRCGAHL